MLNERKWRRCNTAHPVGAKTYFVPRELVEQIPEVNSHILQEFLWTIMDWKHILKASEEFQTYLQKYPRLRPIFEKMNVI